MYMYIYIYIYVYIYIYREREREKERERERERVIYMCPARVQLIAKAATAVMRNQLVATVATAA